MSLRDLKEFEKKADSLAEHLPTWKLPIRVVLTGLYVAIDQLIHGSIDGSDPPRVHDGEGLAHRLSHLTRFLVRCPTEPTPTGYEALEWFVGSDPDFSNCKELVAYAHFCDLMPEVRKNYYSVSRKYGGFDLTHPSKEFSDAEAKDILLSELSMGFEEGPSPKVSLRCGILTRGIEVDESWRSAEGLALQIEVLKELYEHAYVQVVEPPILSDAGFHAAIGCGLEDFLRFRAALVAFARFCQTMGMWHRGEMTLGNNSVSVAAEYSEWVSVCWRDHHFFEMVRQMAGLTTEQAERLFSIFSIDMRKDEPEFRHARDGFFPPIWRLPGHVLFNPEVLGRFLSTRNLAFALNLVAKEHFAIVVSQHLEPQLVRTACDILALAGDDLEVREDIKWESSGVRGQIDLLVYFLGDEVAWHVQAKGAIPPQGARMTAALEGRVEEALKQTASFSNLPESERHRIISRAIGRTVAPSRIVDVVLLRSCAGGYRVWSAKNDNVFLTLPLLAALVRRCREQKSLSPLVNCQASVERYTEEFLRSAAPVWEQDSISLAGEEISMPMLKYDTKVVEEERRRIWEGMAIGTGRGNPWKVVSPVGSGIRVAPGETGPRRPQTQQDQILNALRLMDQHPTWEDGQFGKATGLHPKFLRSHPLTQPVLRLLDAYRKRADKKRRSP